MSQQKMTKMYQWKKDRQGGC